MKKLILLFVLTSFYSNAQSGWVMNVWRVTPDTVCSGDSIKVDFKYSISSGTHTAHIYFTLPTVVEIWHDDFANFGSYPTETFPNSAGPCSYIKIQVPYNTSPGGHPISVSNGTCYCMALHVNNCTTGIQEEQSETELKPVYYDLMGNKIEPRKGELIIQQIGNRRKKVIIN